MATIIRRRLSTKSPEHTPGIVAEPETANLRPPTDGTSANISAQNSASTAEPEVLSTSTSGDTSFKSANTSLVEESNIDPEIQNIQNMESSDDQAPCVEVLEDFEPIKDVSSLNQPSGLPMVQVLHDPLQSTESVKVAPEAIEADATPSADIGEELSNINDDLEVPEFTTEEVSPFVETESPLKESRDKDQQKKVLMPHRTLTEENSAKDRPIKKNLSHYVIEELVVDDDDDDLGHKGDGADHDGRQNGNAADRQEKQDIKPVVQPTHDIIELDDSDDDEPSGYIKPEPVEEIPKTEPVDQGAF